MTFNLAFSPCPNDTFIFDALIHHKIDTKGFRFNVVLDDVESLNKKAFDQTFDITKLSFHACLYLTDKYKLLPSGSALGDHCGPLLIGRSSILPKSQESMHVAIPGKYTTANYLMSIAYPCITDKKEMLFSEIEDAVLSKKTDAGVIIHENRFTYESKGLFKIMDLGEYWHSQTQMPIPLGGIAIKRKYSLEISQKVSHLIKKSIEYAFANPESGKNFIKAHSREMNDEVIQKHIDLYVNNYTLDLGEKGKKAIEMMLEKAVEAHLDIHTSIANLF
jgi:1,4-dihydroxy-6-naphthoate synthase